MIRRSTRVALAVNVAGSGLDVSTIRLDPPRDNGAQFEVLALRGAEEVAGIRLRSLDSAVRAHNAYIDHYTRIYAREGA